ncbi:MAG: ubiquinol-cytochrome c reductase iron-sulfur subunit [Acidobacteriota bacterium]
MTVHNTTEENNTERRTFLGVVSGLIVAGISAVLGVTIGRFAISPALSATAAQAWTDVGPLADIPDGKLVKRNVIVSQSAGWGEFNSQKLVWVIKNGEKITVFTAVCPHLGCTVNARQEVFICACHDSKWDVAGNALGGPTPRGLDALEHKVEGDVLKVRYQDFKQGVSQKEVLS